MSNSSFVTIQYLYEQSKFWIGLGGFLWSAFKTFNWVKDIREKDLSGLKSDLASTNNEIRQQTTVIDRGFQDLRADFRTFYISPDPLMMPVQARARKRKSVAARGAVKAKASTKSKVTKQVK